MTTTKHAFKYFVKPDFDPEQKSQVDKQVDRAYVTHLQEECYSEMVI